ncbi:hypothetical protein ACEPAH_3060 [Sanghuangporus vaninii]
MHRPQTPENRIRPQDEHLIKATPASYHSTHGHDFLSEGLDSMRDAVLRDFHYAVPEIDPESFVKNILPPLKDGVNIEDIVASLKSGGIITPDGKLKPFETDPCKQKSAEDMVFAPLEDICRQITLLATRTAPDVEQVFVLKLLPHVTPKSDRDSTTRPDAYFILKAVEDQIMHAIKKEDKVRWWYDIGPTGEFKKGNSPADRNDNVGKLFFSIHQTMNLDPCRRFALGFTVENTDMRLWFCSRGNPVVSTEFKFATRVDLLIHIFLSFAFASKEELGWDLSIRPVIKGTGKRIYRIDIGDKIYETRRILSEDTADSLVSRATRTWEATDLETGEPYVIKDVWIDDDRELEHDIYNAILSDIEKKFGTDVKREVASHLLTPVQHCFVQANGQDDHTTDVMMRGLKLSFKEAFDLKIREVKGNDAKKSIGPSAASDTALRQTRLGRRHPFSQHHALFRKKHYRVVFKETGLALYTLRKLPNIFTVLRDSVKALKWVHECGWTHRDVGLNNIYLYYGRGLIGDLEYAKYKYSQATHKIRSGSTDCMPVEVMKNRYLYYKERYKQGVDDDKTLEQLLTTVVKKEESRTSPAFNHTYIEKLSWMPAQFEGIRNVLNSLRKTLVTKYQEFESHLPEIRMDTIRGTHDTFERVFELCRKASNGIEFSPAKTTGLRQDLLAEEIMHEIPGAQPDPDSSANLDAETEEPRALMETLTLTDDDDSNDFLTPMPIPRKARYTFEI